MEVGFVGAAIAVNTACSLWQTYLESRQLRAMDTPFAALPPSTQRLTTFEVFERSQAYSRDKLRLTIFKRLSLDLVVENVKFATKFLGKSWAFVSAKTGLVRGSFLHSWAWGSLYDVAELCIKLPFDAYSTFVVEQRHGFNQTTVRTFVLDRLKSLALSSLVFRPILTAVLRWVVASFGPRFPIYLCGASAVLMAAATFIVPTLIMPLFNKFENLGDGEVKSRLQALADRVSFPLKKLYTMDGSKRSAHSNAYLYGFGANKRIVLFDTLLEQLTAEEIEAVVGHEIGHWHFNHLPKSFAVSMLYVLAFGQGSTFTMFNPAAYEAFGMPIGTTDPIVGTEIFSAFWQPAQTVIGTCQCFLSRRFEFQADEFAARLGYEKALRSGLAKLQEKNKASLTPDWLFAACTFSHPPLTERLRNIERKSQ